MTVCIGIFEHSSRILDLIGQCSFKRGMPLRLQRNDFNLDLKSLDLLPSYVTVCWTKGNVWIELEIS